MSRHVPSSRHDALSALTAVHERPEGPSVDNAYVLRMSGMLRPCVPLARPSRPHEATLSSITYRARSAIVLPRPNLALSLDYYQRLIYTARVYDVRWISRTENKWTGRRGVPTTEEDDRGQTPYKGIIISRRHATLEDDGQPINEMQRMTSHIKIAHLLSAKSSQACFEFQLFFLDRVILISYG